MKSAFPTIALGITVSGLVPGPRAATPTASFAVTATVQAACMVSASAITSGSNSGTTLKATSTTSVNCTLPTPYTISIDAGPAIDAAAPAQKTADAGSDLMRYALVSNSQAIVQPAHTISAETLAAAANHSSQTLAGDPQCSTDQYIATGAYPNTIAITVIY